MKKRGVIYIVWGDKAAKVLDRSIASLKRFHPHMPVEVFRLDGDESTEHYLKKARMASMTPFEQTLFLDADTIVMDTLDFGFEKAKQFGLACCINENPWACRYGGLSGDMVEYNTGVLFFTPKAAPIFQAWEDIAPNLDSSIRYIMNGKVVVMPHADQGSFAKAVDVSGMAPFVLPMNWNFRPGYHRAFFGKMKIWHDYNEPPPAIDQQNDYYRQKDSITQFCIVAR
jgi:hypothetical protein